MLDVFLRRKHIKCGATAEHKKSKAPHEKVRLASKPRIKHGPEGIAVTILNLQEYRKYRPIHDTYSQSKEKSQYLAKQATQSQTPL